VATPSRAPAPPTAPETKKAAGTSKKKMTQPRKSKWGHDPAFFDKLRAALWLKMWGPAAATALRNVTMDCIRSWFDVPSATFTRYLTRAKEEVHRAADPRRLPRFFPRTLAAPAPPRSAAVAMQHVPGLRLPPYETAETAARFRTIYSNQPKASQRAPRPRRKRKATGKCTGSTEPSPTANVRRSTTPVIVALQQPPPRKVRATRCFVAALPDGGKTLQMQRPDAPDVFAEFSQKQWAALRHFADISVRRAVVQLRHRITTDMVRSFLRSGQPQPVRHFPLQHRPLPQNQHLPQPCQQSFARRQANGGSFAGRPILSAAACH
jgi:hypothetical protein